MDSVAGLKRKYRIGIDVGGTNTDAVLLCDAKSTSADHGIVSFHKTLTTKRVTDGIEAVIRHVLDEGRIDPSAVAVVTVGTTHFLNAVVEQDMSRLDPVAVLRLSSAYTQGVPPFCDFPPKLAKIMHGYHAFCRGGCNIDGSQIVEIDELELRQQARNIRALGLKTIVLTGVYSPIDVHFQQEQKAKKFVLDEFPEATIVCSRDIGGIGILERENAAILNASILGFAQKTIREYNAVLSRTKLTCPLYLTQNDGTLISSLLAAATPVRTFSSGATNSMRGAAYLSRLSHVNQNVIVLDIGGTTCDAGLLLPSGYPREAARHTTFAGVRVNFPMPYLISIGLGGGSIIRTSEEGNIRIGPDSVGHELRSSSKIFGGDILTTSDIAVASGLSHIGDPAHLAQLDPDLVFASRKEINSMLSSLVEQIKTSPESTTVLLVGGGSIIAPFALDGASEVVRPEYHDVANAVGAATAKTSGQVDRVEVIGQRSMAELVASCISAAKSSCVAAAGDPKTITVTEVTVVPIPFCIDSVRVTVKCVGDLLIDSLPSPQSDKVSAAESQTSFARPFFVQSYSEFHLPAEDGEEMIDLVTYRPHINSDRLWVLSELDLKLLALGCYVLGCAGGGSPYAEYLQLRHMLRDGHVFRVADLSSLRADDIVLYGGYMGSPAVSVERPSADEFFDATNELLQFLNLNTCSAVMGFEIGGGNGLQAFFVSSSRRLNVPCIDADWMGRAFPTYYQTTLCVHKKGQLTPAAISSGAGRAMIMTKANDDEIVDVALRAACSEMGSRVGMACKPVSGADVQDYAVLNSLSLAWRIGRAIQICQQTCTLCDIAERIIDEVGGPGAAKKLYCGKILSVENKLYKGHSYGSITIKAASEAQEGRPLPVKTDGFLHIPHKNENILAEHETLDGAKTILATVPDLICVLDANSGEALGVSEFRYGLKVIVLGITASPRWTSTPEGLVLGGPAAFGHDIKYEPLGVYKTPRSVIEEFAPVVR